MAFKQRSSRFEAFSRAQTESCDGSSTEEFVRRGSIPFTLPDAMDRVIGNVPGEGRDVMLSKKALAELFNSMREAADGDPSSQPAHSKLLPFAHLRVRTMGGLHKLRMPQAERFRQPQLHKYLAVVVQFAVLVINLWLLLQSLCHTVYIVIGLATMDEQLSTGHIQVGFLSAADRQNLVAIFEGVGLLWYLVRLAVTVGEAQSGAEKGLEGLRRWAAHATIYWELLPALRTFSALRMLRRVHPQLLPMELGALVKTLQREHAPVYRKLLVLVCFFGHRMLILYFGFQAFIFKFTCTAARLQARSGSPTLQLYISFAFLNQLLGGVVQLEKLMRNRLILFLFGGEDAYIDAEEAALMHVWLACLARTLHLQATARKGLCPQLRSLVVICCFNHMDLQQIVLLEDPDQVTRRHSIIRQYSRVVVNGGLGLPDEVEVEVEEPSFKDLLEAGGDHVMPNTHVLLRD